MSMKPGALALAGRRLPVNGEARHHSVGSSVHPPRPGGGTDADRGNPVDNHALVSTFNPPTALQTTFGFTNRRLAGPHAVLRDVPF